MEIEKNERFRFERLTVAKCTRKEIDAITDLFKVFQMHDNSTLISATDIKLSCRKNSVFVARSREERGEPVIGIATLLTTHLLNGMNAMIEFPVIQPGYETVSEFLLEKVIMWARGQGISRIEVIHRLLGVKWQHSQALRNLGFQTIGAKVYHFNI
jgi:hypothetical protein